MSNRDLNIAKAREILAICEARSYRTTLAGRDVQVSLSGLEPAVFIPAAETDALCFPEKGPCPSVSVTNRSAVQDLMKAYRARPDARVGLLNFASSLHPGGGFITGAIAQEEALCHASTLYWQLKNCPRLYEENKRNNSDTYTDNMALSTTFFFVNESGLRIPQPVKALVVTSAAVNQNKVRDRHSQRVNSVMRRRMHKIIQLFIREEVQTVILGAFGCGVFRNDPVFIAEVWKEELERYGGYFDEVIFSVKGDWDSRNVRAFTDLFGG